MKLYTIGYGSDRIGITRAQVPTALREGARVYELTMPPASSRSYRSTFRAIAAGVLNTKPTARSRYTGYLTGEEARVAIAAGQAVEWLTPCLDTEDAMLRSGAWMHAGSAAHGFDGGPEEQYAPEPWCRQCGCGEGGGQHHGGMPEINVPAFTEDGEQLYGLGGAE